jgi:hypothetical protein
LPDLADQFGSDHFERVVAHRFHRALVRREGIIKGKLVVGEAKVIAAFGKRPNSFASLFSSSISSCVAIARL